MCIFKQNIALITSIFLKKVPKTEHKKVSHLTPALSKLRQFARVWGFGWDGQNHINILSGAAAKHFPIKKYINKLSIAASCLSGNDRRLEAVSGSPVNRTERCCARATTIASCLVQLVIKLLMLHRTANRFNSTIFEHNYKIKTWTRLQTPAHDSQSA